MSGRPQEERDEISVRGRILEAAFASFMKNGYVVGCDTTRKAVVIDPGDEVDQLIDAVGRHGLSVDYILLTHAHLDHITGVGRAKAAFGAPRRAFASTPS